MRAERYSNIVWDIAFVVFLYLQAHIRIIPSIVLLCLGRCMAQETASIKCLSHVTPRDIKLNYNNSDLHSGGIEFESRFKNMLLYLQGLFIFRLSFKDNKNWRSFTHIFF